MAILGAHRKPQVVMIVDREGGESRLLSIDDSGLAETPVGSVDAVADAIFARQPDLVLVNPGALTIGGEKLVNAINRLTHRTSGYTWTPPPGERPGS